MSANGSRFGPEARAAVVARLELGASFAAAAAAAGVKVPTAKTWLARGRREPSGAYRDFADAVERARAGVGSTASGSGVPDRVETLQLLSTAARRGSVQAMRELIALARTPTR